MTLSVIIGRILTASIPGKAAGKEAMTVQSKANITVYIVPDVVNY